MVLREGWVVLGKGGRLRGALFTTVVVVDDGV